MSYLEPLSFCSLEEYQRHEPNRLQRADVETGELYTYMTKLRGAEREASRSTVRVIGQVAAKQMLTVMFHNDKLEEVLEAEVALNDEGYVIPVSQIELLDRRNDKANRMMEGYLRDYFQDFYDDVLTRAVEKELAGSVSSS